MLCMTVIMGSANSEQITNMYKLEIKIKLRSFKSSECINEKGDGPYHGFGFLSLFSEPIDLAT